MNKRLALRNSPHEIQLRLLVLAAIFLFVFSLILTFAPAARARTWDVELRWSHWLGFVTWCFVFFVLHTQVRRHLPDADPYLLPITSLLTGWGMLTIWRLIPAFGFRQAIWIFLAGIVLALGVRLAPKLHFLRRFKYLFLTAGISLTALTLFFGTNPQGGDLNLWLGCCGLYLQPSEPLKLLFLIYLAAYLSKHLPFPIRIIPLLAPTAVFTGLALFLLVVQRDLGTASIFIFLYSATLYMASGKKRLLLFTLVALAAAGVAGYFLFDVVRLRVDAWINPWLDPSGRSFQVVQSLMAIANGGLSGRGPGMGSPGLVPVAISDFIFTAIAEETGLVGVIGLLALYALLIFRGLSIALRAPDNFRRILAAALTAYVGAQAILIIGGNTRLLPLTGVTLPFVSYGGSSYLTSSIGLLLLLLISSPGEEEPAPLPNPAPILHVGAFLGLGLLALALVTGWWAIYRNPSLLARTDNARRTIADRYVRRGSLVDRNQRPINLTLGQSGDYFRTYDYPPLSAIVGYTNATYGQAGLESSLDPYLRGLQGNPARLIWLDHLLYGQPPPGLDIRLSLDLHLQARADFLLGSHQGAVVVLSAHTGEILAMASHPVFDANLLDTTAEALLADPASPLLNRAAQVTYPPGDSLAPFLLAAGLEQETLLPEDLNGLYSALGFFAPPQATLPVAEAVEPGDPLQVSPLQMALGAATLSNQGIRPAPVLATALRSTTGNWIILLPADSSLTAFSPQQASLAAEAFTLPGSPFWLFTTSSSQPSGSFTWSLGGTLPNWPGTPVVVVVLLEEQYDSLAAYACEQLLLAAIQP